MRLFYEMKSNLYNVYIFKCVSITNISTGHGGCYEAITKKTKQEYNEKQTFFERLYWVVFQFFIRKYCVWENNIFWCSIISTRKHDAGGWRWTQYYITMALRLFSITVI